MDKSGKRKPSLNLSLRFKKSSGFSKSKRKIDHRLFADDPVLVKNGLKDGINPNIKNNEGRTPLLNALHEKYETKVEIVRILLANDMVDMNVVTKNKWSVLHYACSKEFGGNEDILKLILTRRDININCQNEYGDTPLHFSSIFGYVNITTIILNDNRLILNIRNRWKNTSFEDVVTMTEHYEIMKLFLEKVKTKEIDINRKNFKKETVIIKRQKRDFKNMDFEVIKLFLEIEQFDPNVQDDNGDTVLHLAAKKNDKESILLLLKDKRTNVSLKNKKQKTFLDLTQDENLLKLAVSEDML